MNRRQYLTAVGVTTVLAGCLGDPESNGPSESAGDATSDQNAASTERPASDQRANAGGPDASETATDRASFQQRWGWELEGDVYPTPYDAALHRNTLYIGSDRGLVALETTDGSERWRETKWTAYKDVHADRHGVVVYTQNSQVGALDPESGDLLWRNVIKTLPAFRQPLASGVSSEIVTIPVRDGPVRIYDRDTGGQIQELGDRDSKHLITVDGIVVLADPSRVVAYDPVSGSERWRLESDTVHIDAHSTGQFVGRSARSESAAPDTVVALDPATGSERWAVSGPVSGNRPVFTNETTVSFLSGHVGESRRVHALDTTDGGTRWAESLGKSRTPMDPVITGDFLIAEGDNAVSLFDTADGTVHDRTDSSLLFMQGVADNDTFFECGPSVSAYRLVTP